MTYFILYSILTFVIFFLVLMQYPHQFDSSSPKWHIIALSLLGGPIFWAFVIISSVINLFNWIIEKFDGKFNG